VKRAAQLGLQFDDEDKEVFSLMATTDAIIRSRYIRTGYFQWPAPEALARTGKNIHQTVSAILRRDGVLVRQQ
jgi:hypothetical protein